MLPTRRELRTAPVTAVVPACGVRLGLPGTRPGEDRFVSIGDLGGRGEAVAAAFVAVVLREGGLRVLGPDGAEYARDASGTALYAALERRMVLALFPHRAGAARARYLTALPAASGDAQWLVLLLYVQSPGTGADIADADSAGGPGAAPAEVIEDVVRLVQRTPEAQLQTALVRPAPMAARATADESRCFALASCQYPASLLDATPPGAEGRLAGPADRSYLRLARRLARGEGLQPRFLVLAGDQVYVDSTADVFDTPSAEERFRDPYERYYGSAGPRSVFCRLPALIGLDDHEISDNWEPEPDNPLHELHLEWERRGRDEYLRYQRDLGPGEPQRSRGGPPPLWAPSEVDGLPFFITDTRTERDARTAACVERARMMGAAQWQALLAWLAARRDVRPAFVVSAAILLPRQAATRRHGASAIRSDAWDGYPASLHALLARMCEWRLSNVTFLSGNEHRCCEARVRVWPEGDEGAAVPFVSVHGSALYAPYPFANSRPEDFALEERFAFEDPEEGHRRYVCEVRSRFAPPQDGYALVQVHRDGAQWELNVCFDLTEGEHVHCMPAHRF
jgi:hypothetical protein